MIYTYQSDPTGDCSKLAAVELLLLGHGHLGCVCASMCGIFVSEHNSGGARIYKLHE